VSITASEIGLHTRKGLKLPFPHPIVIWFPLLDSLRRSDTMPVCDGSAVRQTYRRKGRAPSTILATRKLETLRYSTTDEDHIPLRSLILTQYCNVTDRRTDGETDGRICRFTAFLQRFYGASFAARCKSEDQVWVTSILCHWTLRLKTVSPNHTNDWLQNDFLQSHILPNILILIYFTLTFSSQYIDFRCCHAWSALTNF